MRSALHRERATYLALLALVIALGLASRRYAPALPAVVGHYAGDTLWATAVLLAAAVAWPAARTRTLAAGAALLSLTVELSQLAHPAWLEAVRRWPGARLLLGYGFLPGDLLCYAAGVSLGAGLDHLLRRRRGLAPRRRRR